jgi:polyphosphate kinase 2 (PPK2 family)
MKIDSDDFRVREEKTIDLKKWPTEVQPYYKSKKDLETMLSERIKELSELQTLLYASDRYAVLLIFQAMDAAGKDSAIKHVMSGVNPQGCQVFSFKHPSAEELDHDFLWRTTRALPERGRIGIFNRSYYEEVLIVRVHPEILQAERLPDGAVDEKSIWRNRFRRSDSSRHTCIATAHKLSSSFSISRKRSSGSVSLRGWRSRTRIGNSIVRISKRGNIGRTI